jgi:CTP:molybdopterin cytidylyltransferase MocA
MPIDIAVPRPETLSALMDAGSGVPVDPQGRPGHPVLVPPHVLRAVLAAPKQGGLRAYLDDLPRVHVADPLVALDFDNPAAWAAYRAAWEEGNG